MQSLSLAWALLLTIPIPGARCQLSGGSNDIALFSDFFDAQTSSDASVSTNTFPNIPVALSSCLLLLLASHKYAGKSGISTTAVEQLPKCQAAPPDSRLSSQHGLEDQIIPGRTKMLRYYLNASPPIFVKATQVRPRMSS